MNKNRRNYRHGHKRVNYRSPTYLSWTSMKTRCFNPKAYAYHRYGGRGITVCDRWMDFPNFLEDMGVRPKGKQLDRIDNDGNYEPGNCRWANRASQSVNKKQANQYTKG